MTYKKDNKLKSDFKQITIGLASPEQILAMSHGEVTKPETVNYRTYKPNETACSASVFSTLKRLRMPLR